MQQTEKNKEVFKVEEEIYSFIKFPYGNSLIIDRAGEKIELVNNQNEIQLSIQFTPDGLQVNLTAAKLNMHAVEELNLSSKKIGLTASEQINLKSSGNIVQQAGKDFFTETQGTNKNIAKVQKIHASLGNIELKANDDVRLNGESVQLNCDE